MSINSAPVSVIPTTEVSHVTYQSTTHVMDDVMEAVTVCPTTTVSLVLTTLTALFTVHVYAELTTQELIVKSTWTTLLVTQSVVI
jgi:hypothetical protein